MQESGSPSNMKKWFDLVADSFNPLLDDSEILRVRCGNGIKSDASV